MSALGSLNSAASTTPRSSAGDDLAGRDVDHRHAQLLEHLRRDPGGAELEALEIRGRLQRLAGASLRLRGLAERREHHDVHLQLLLEQLVVELEPAAEVDHQVVPEFMPYGAPGALPKSVAAGCLPVQNPGQEWRRVRRPAVERVEHLEGLDDGAGRLQVDLDARPSSRRSSRRALRVDLMEVGRGPLLCIFHCVRAAGAWASAGPRERRDEQEQRTDRYQEARGAHGGLLRG